MVQYDMIKTSTLQWVKTEEKTQETDIDAETHLLVPTRIL